MDIPANYRRLEGSERHPEPGTRFIGPADPNESLSVTIVLRRRPDGTPMPDLDSFAAAPLDRRQRLSSDEFAAKYGASQDDINRVTEFAKAQGLNVVETNAARRTIVVSGTVAQMSKAFGVTLGRYQHEITFGRRQKPQSEIYRGREGFIHIPDELSDIIVGVFGLDNRTIMKRNSADPPNTTPIGVPQVAQLYNYPTNSAAGQTIGIVSLTGYDIHDIQLYFAGLPAGYNMPTVNDVLVHGSNSGFDPYGETTQDIDLAASFAPGSAINVYITTGDQQGWVDLINRVAHPNAGDAQCSVLSSSWYICDGDDAGTLANEGISTAFVNAVSAAFQDAALQGITVCIAAGDTGSNSKVGADPSAWGYGFAGDGKAHVQYPGSDPSVLSVGGTTIGNVIGSNFDEYVWNDPSAGDPSQWGTTGGGISDFFGLPSYQSGAGVPQSVNDNHAGRGVPDVAGNASFNSGYSGLFLGGNPMIGNGTSASAPQWAGLIAVINAAIGQNVGFVNPILYYLGSSVFRDINSPPGPADNSNSGITGYPARIGWDACTGWGSPNGMALLGGLNPIPTITWANPPDIFYGTALDATQLNATAPVPGTFAYNPGLGTCLPAGIHTLSVTFTPDNPYYQTVMASVQIHVLKATPIITWPNPPDIDHGDPLPASALNATSSWDVCGAIGPVPGTFTYDHAPGDILPVGSDTLNVLFTPSDNSDYNNATASVQINVLTGYPIVTSVTFSPTDLQQGDRVEVAVTLKNDSVKPHATQGPDPGFEYSEGDTFQTKGFPSIAGAYRFGVDLEASPYKVADLYRWGFGHTLAPGEVVSVNGYIRFHNSRENGQYFVAMIEEVNNVLQDHQGTTGITVERP